MSRGAPIRTEWINGRIRAAGPLTTPALLSHLTPTLPGEEGDGFAFSFLKPPLSRWVGVRRERGGRGSEGLGGAENAGFIDNRGIG